MSGEIDLNKLLKTLSPVLMEDEYVFCTFPNADFGDRLELKPFAAVRESEGLTLIVPKSRADEKEADYDSVFRGISLAVHSSLEAVGLTAAVSSKLAEQGISANLVAGFYHDHIFVQSGLADAALAAIKDLAEDSPI